MININPMLLCDTYKQCHQRMYSENLEYLTSYWVPFEETFMTIRKRLNGQVD